MLSAFRLEAGLLTRIIEPADEQALENSIWIDLAESTPEERQLVEELHQQVLPRSDDLEEIEASSRSYVDERGVHISSMFLQRTEGREETVNVALLLTPERFISLHEPEVAALRLLRMRAASSRRRPRRILPTVARQFTADGTRAALQTLGYRTDRAALFETQLDKRSFFTTQMRIPCFHATHFLSEGVALQV